MQKTFLTKQEAMIYKHLKFEIPTLQWRRTYVCCSISLLHHKYLELVKVISRIPTSPPNSYVCLCPEISQVTFIYHSSTIFQS